MKRVSLRRVLVVQWALFTAVLLLGAGGVAVIALFVLEDSFIDERLLAAERALPGEPAPATAVLRRLDALPAERHAMLAALAPGSMREFRIDADRYVHLRVLAPDAQGPRFLVYEAHDALRVGAGLRRGAPTLLALLVLLVLLAGWMGHRFAGRVERAARALLPPPGRHHDGQTLRAASAAQPIEEFRQIGLSLADALQQRLDALQREEDLQRFLAHELRTPLQSARLALAALPSDAAGQRQRERLQRALQRLQRAAAAVLWLGENTPAAEPSPVAPIARELLDELAPLAAQRGQQIELEERGALHWPLPAAAIAAILGNLLLNAIQHGGQGTLSLRLDGDALQLCNPCEPQIAAGGFGLGMELVRRLLAPIGWQLRLDVEQGRACARLSRAIPEGRTCDQEPPSA